MFTRSSRNDSWSYFARFFYWYVCFEACAISVVDVRIFLGISILLLICIAFIVVAIVRIKRRSRSAGGVISLFNNYFLLFILSKFSECNIGSTQFEQTFRLQFLSFRAICYAIPNLFTVKNKYILETAAVSHASTVGDGSLTIIF